jgi:tetratricopeptide (TPR) repeat protein
MATESFSKTALTVAPPRTGDAQLLLDQAARAEREGQRAAARQLYEQVLWATSETLTPAHCCTALLGAARTFHMDGHSDAALDCLDAAEVVATASRSHASLGAVMNARAVLEWQRGNLDDAERLYMAAQQFASKGDDQRLVAMVAQNRGNVAAVRGEFSRALVHYRASMEAYRGLGLVPQLCGVLNNIGMVHTDLGQWDDAERAFRDAIEAARASGDVVTRLLIDVNVAELAIVQEDFGRAREVCGASLRRARTIGDKNVEAELLKHL